MWKSRRRRGNAPEEATVPAQPPAPVRAYTKSGKVAHLLGPDGNALCPNMAGIEWAVWLGSGTDEEKARLASLPPCRACERAAGKAAS